MMANILNGPTSRKSRNMALKSLSIRIPKDYSNKSVSLKNPSLTARFILVYRDEPLSFSNDIIF